jgi:allantoin racemase
VRVGQNQARLRIANILPAGWSGVMSTSPADEWPEVSVEAFSCLLPAGLASTPLALAVKDFIFVEAGLRAEEAGFDAVFVNTVCDYGLPELRSCLQVPVLGAGESAVRAALAQDARFAVVTVWPEASSPLFERVVERSGGSGQCVSIRHVFSEAELADLGGAQAVADGITRQRELVVRAVIDTCHAAINEDDAQIVVLGCTCMSAAASRLAGAVGVPVVDPLTSGLMAARRAADAGRSPTLRGQAQAAASRTEQAQVRLMVSALAEADIAPVADPCPVCVA